METIDRKFVFLAVNPCNGHIYTEKNAVVFCAKDKALPTTLRKYREECNRLGCNPEHLESIDLLIEREDKYQAEVESRIPDTIGDCELGRCLAGIGV